MKTFFTIYKQSIKYLAKQPATYIVFVIALLINVFVMIVIPLVIPSLGFQDFYSSTSWLHTVFPANLFSFVIFFAIIGEANALRNESVFILSKSVNRGAFLTAKILSTLTYCFIFIFVIIAMFLIIAWDVYVHNLHEWIFSEGVCQFGGLIASYLSTMLLVGVFTTIYKYFLKGGMPLLVTLLIVGAYIVIYPMFFDIDSTAGPLTHPLLFSSVLPSVFFAPLALIFGAFGYYKFYRSEATV